MASARPGVEDQRAQSGCRRTDRLPWADNDAATRWRPRCCYGQRGSKRYNLRAGTPGQRIVLAQYFRSGIERLAEILQHIRAAGTIHLDQRHEFNVCSFWPWKNSSHDRELCLHP